MSENRKFLQDERPDPTNLGRMSDFEFWACMVIIAVIIIGGLAAWGIDKVHEDDAAACIEHGQCK